MRELINVIIITSIWCIGLTIATQKDMVLYFIREWAEKKDGKFYMTVIKCIWCMPTVHSLFGLSFSILMGVCSISWKLIVMYPLIIMGSSLVSGFIWSICEYISVKTKHVTNVEQLSYFDLKDRKRNYNSRNLK